MSRFNPFKTLMAGISFLTVLPAGKMINSTDDLRRSVVLFPVIGFLIGGISLIIPSLVLNFTGRYIPGIIAVISFAILSRGLHYDGLADTFDGFLSGKDRSGMLEVMKDSRIGTMGALALIFIILLTIVSLGELKGNRLPILILLTPAVGRWAIVQQICFCKYSRPSGLGLVFVQKNGYLTAAFSTALLLIPVVILVGFSGLISIAFTALILVLFSLWCQSKIGGTTGDTYGAASTIAEAAFLLGMVLVQNFNAVGI